MSGDFGVSHLTRLDVLSISCWTYLVIAVIVLLLGVFKQDAAPHMYEAFTLSGFRWLLGAFAAQAPPSA